MRVMVLVKATSDSEKKGYVPTPETLKMMEDMGKFNDELKKAGILVTADGLRPTSAGKRVAFNGTDRKVIEGPFEPSSEQVAGFWIWNVKNMEEAIQWVKRCPNPMAGPSEIEIRPFYEREDLV